MKEIILTQGKVAIVDDEDFDYLNQFRWCVVHDGYMNYYAMRAVFISRKKTRKYYMHRVIMKLSSNLEVDHIDGNTLNNKKENLRVVTHSQNLYNTRGHRAVKEYYNELKNSTE